MKRKKYVISCTNGAVLLEDYRTGFKKKVVQNIVTVKDNLNVFVWKELQFDQQYAGQ